MKASQDVFLQPEEEQRAAEKGSDELFQVVRNSAARREAPDTVRRNLGEIIKVSLRSKAESTNKSFVNIIIKAAFRMV